MKCLDKIYYYTYTLESANTLNSVSNKKLFTGALLRNETGYSCIHPWEEFGDLPLNKQLESISNNHPTDLAKIALNFLEIDSSARKNNLLLFEKESYLDSHRLVSDIKDLEHLQEFPLIKVKIGKDVNLESLLINNYIKNSPNTKIRLDCNGVFTYDSFCDFFDLFSDDTKLAIDFIEDPIKYMADSWSKLKNKVRLAYDFYSSSLVDKNYQVRIIKPSAVFYNDIFTKEILNNTEICITTTLGHPLSVCHAAWVQNQSKKMYSSSILAGGITSFTSFKKDSFSEIIWGLNDNFIIPDGTGFGFNGLLDGLNWKKLQ